MSNGNSGIGIELKLVSGFTIHVRALPPYYIDIIDNALPIPEFPKRKIALASGDVAEWPYEPTEDASDPNHEDHDLYVKWKSTLLERGEVELKRTKARKDFLLANCVHILEGPVDIDSDEWAEQVEAAFEGYEVPEHPGKRMLVFLKTQVISSPEEVEIIMKAALSQEVSTQGILNALLGFRDKVEEGRSSGRHRKTSKR